MRIPSKRTKYKRTTFRSRLEARWAVFFTKMKVKWMYEPDWFILGKEGNTIAYKPDFYLPEKGVWIEVKPVIRIRNKDMTKISYFAKYSKLNQKIKNNFKGHSDIVILQSEIEATLTNVPQGIYCKGNKRNPIKIGYDGKSLLFLTKRRWIKTLIYHEKLLKSYEFARNKQF